MITNIVYSNNEYFDVLDIFIDEWNHYYNKDLIVFADTPYKNKKTITFQIVKDIITYKTVPHKKITPMVFAQISPKTQKYPPKNTIYTHFYKHIKQMYICAFFQVKNLLVCHVHLREGTAGLFCMFRTTSVGCCVPPPPYYNKKR